MWVIAGPNGSGKTTITRSTRIQDMIGDYAYLNADDVTQELLAKYQPIRRRPANLAAATIVDGQVDGLIEDGVSFVVETVLSSPKYKSRVRAARKAGFKIGFVFVYVQSPLLNTSRVQMRALTGGHNVLPDVVKARWPKSIRNFSWFANRADYVLLIDNSGLKPRDVLVKKVGQSWIRHQPAKSRVVEQAIDKALRAQVRFKALKSA
jgi:predicted ABC-type ATPase